MKANDTNLVLAPRQVSIDVLLEKYAKGDQCSIKGGCRRVARALAAVETDQDKWEPLFFEALENGFIPCVPLRVTSPMAGSAHRSRTSRVRDRAGD